MLENGYKLCAPASGYCFYPMISCVFPLSPISFKFAHDTYQVTTWCYPPLLFVNRGLWFRYLRTVVSCPSVRYGEPCLFSYLIHSSWVLTLSSLVSLFYSYGPRAPSLNVDKQVNWIKNHSLSIFLKPTNPCLHSYESPLARNCSFTPHPCNGLTFSSCSMMEVTCYFLVINFWYQTHY